MAALTRRQRATALAVSLGALALAAALGRGRLPGQTATGASAPRPDASACAFAVDWLGHAEFSPSGRYLLAGHALTEQACAGSGRVVVWDLDQGRALPPIEPLGQGEARRMQGAAWSKDETRLALHRGFHEGAVTLHEVGGWRQLGPGASYPLPRSLLPLDDRVVGFGASGGGAALELSTGRLLASAPARPDDLDLLREVVDGNDGATLVALHDQGLFERIDRGTLRARGEPLEPAEQLRLQAAAVHPGRPLLATCDWDGEVRVRDVRGGAVLRREALFKPPSKEQSADPIRLAWSPTRAVLAAIQTDGSLVLWDTEPGGALRRATLTKARAQGPHPAALRWTADGHALLVFREGGALLRVDPEAPAEAALLIERPLVPALRDARPLGDGSRLLLSFDGGHELWKLHPGAGTLLLRLPPGEAALDPRGRFVAVAGGGILLARAADGASLVLGALLDGERHRAVVRAASGLAEGDEAARRCVPPVGQRGCAALAAPGPEAAGLLARFARGDKHFETP